MASIDFVPSTSSNQPIISNKSIPNANKITCGNEKKQYLEESITKIRIQTMQLPPPILIHPSTPILGADIGDIGNGYRSFLWSNPRNYEKRREKGKTKRKGKQEGNCTSNS